jgi:uncharacterized protein
VFADPAARRERNVANVREYFRLQDERDLDAWLELWAHDCRHLIPFAPYDFPSSLEGRDRLGEVQRDLHSSYRTLEIDATVHPMLDPDLVLACWHTHAELVSGGTYASELIGLFRFDADGKLVELREYLDPIAFLKLIGRS